MNIIKPAKLQEGDTIGVLATSGAIENCNDDILHAVDYFEKLGYKVVLSENVFSKDRYLAGNDEKRVEELHKFFKNPKINAIICLRGGYGAIRIINKIDYSIIRDNPKIFCGYSDITAFNAMFLKRAGLITYSGPMLMSDFAVKTRLPYTMNEFFKALTSNELKIKGSRIIKEGDAKGIFWGGNLATLVSLCGQDFIPDEKFIFFAEDLNEPAYKIDRMMQQLMNIEKFSKNIQAIALGDFIDVDNNEWLEQLFKEISIKLNVPVVTGYRITHLRRKVTIPYGALCTLQDKTLYFN